MSTKIPKQLYVTSKEYLEQTVDLEHHRQTGEYRWTVEKRYRFGFLHPHEPDKKSDLKRKSTQMKWAYGSSDVEADGVYSKSGRCVYTGEVDPSGRQISKYVASKTRVPDEHQPTVLDNVPLTGFEIIDTVTRYSTSNKLVKVMDPRGYVFEITIASLFNIMREGSIVRGVIQEPCVWASNKKLVIHREQK